MATRREGVGNQDIISAKGQTGRNQQERSENQEKIRYGTLLYEITQQKVCSPVPGCIKQLKVHVPKWEFSAISPYVPVQLQKTFTYLIHLR